MVGIFGRKSRVARAQTKSEARHEEYGKDTGGIWACPQCRNVHYKKSWHSADNKLIKAKIGTTKTAKNKLCSACTMIKAHQFEGELMIEGIPERHRQELLNLIQNMGEQATNTDPQDRVIAIEKKKRIFRVTTTENQLAVKMGKKVKAVFNTVDLRVMHEKEPYEVSRVRAVFRDSD